jgi:hypothetical protein
MNLLTMSMLGSAGICGMLASWKGRRPLLWLALGLVAGPIAVAIILWLPSRATRQSAPVARPRSIVDEINALEEMQQRGIISADEFQQGKAQVLAWPLSSPIPAALTPQRVWTDGRRTWESYQAPTRAAISSLARRHGLELRWPDDLPLEVVATFPAQAGLSVEFSIGLEKGAIQCWGPGWDLGSSVLHRPEAGLPAALDHALDALIDGSGRLLIRKALGAPSPFCVSLQVRHNGRWKTAMRRCCVPIPPVWRRSIIRNSEAPESAGRR